MVDRNCSLARTSRSSESGRQRGYARVVSRIVGRSQGHLFGVALLDPTANLWDIAFPAVADLEKAVLRACSDVLPAPGWRYLT